MTDQPAPGVVEMSEPLRLLLVEDSEADAKLVLRMLKLGGFNVQSERVESAPTMAAALERQAWDAVISDYTMPQFTGLDALNILRSAGLDIPFILTSGTVGEEIAVDALKAGASDYVLKGNLSRLPNVLKRELREAAIRAEHRQAQRKLVESEAGLHRAQLMAKLAHVITGPDGSFETWSETLPQLIGMMGSAHMPRSTREWLEILHPEDRTLFRAKAVEAEIQGMRTDVEYRLRRADGAWINVRQVMEPLFLSEVNPDGKWRWFNTLQDISDQTRAEEALRAAEDRYRDLVEHSHALICTHDLEGNLLSVNEAGVRLTGYSRETLLRMNLSDLLAPAVRSFFPAYLAEVRTRGVASGLMLIRTASGEARWWEYRNTLRTQGVPVPIVRGMAQDVTERKAQQRKIERLNRVYAVLSGINTLIVRVRDREELFRESCRIAVEQGKFHIAWVGVTNRDLTRLDPVAQCGMGPDFLEYLRRRNWLDPDENENRPAVGSVIVEGKAMFSNDIRTDPRIRYTNDHVEQGTSSLAVLPLVDVSSVLGVLCLHSTETGQFDDEEKKLLLELAGDISFALEGIKKAEQLDYLAYYDSVTGLANRTLFHERLEQGLAAAGREGRKFALIILDIERFKTINDTLGRHAGDTLLKQIADRMAGHTPNIAWHARIGADHFAIMAPDMQNVDDLVRLTERRLEEFFSPPFQIGETEIRIAAKLGIAVFPGDGADAETLFRNAEAALKKAKASGHRYLFYTQAMNERVAEKLLLENKLRQAIEKDEFVLYYQPKVGSETRSIVGVEALIRWQSPELGLVPPMKFISLLEETGLILPVGFWALKQASLDHRRWVNQGLKAPRVAVNVSPIQLRQRDFVDSVAQAIVDGIAPTGIELEITESLMMEDVEGNIEKLNSVLGLGVTIAIDDFGTGYSSLGYLAKLPVQMLKIDRSFIITMLSETGAGTLVQMMILLAHTLNLKVVAEGVDAEEQAKTLRLLGCDEMQGYLFSRPVPFDQMTALLIQETKSSGG